MDDKNYEWVVDQFYREIFEEFSNAFPIIPKTTTSEATEEPWFTGYLKHLTPKKA